MPSSLHAKKLVHKIHDAYKEAMTSEGFEAALKDDKQIPICLSRRDYSGYMERTFGEKRALVKSIGLNAE